jgi:predicted nucleotidyltransferase
MSQDPGASDASAGPTITQMVQKIVAAFAPVAVVLFGSHARGTARPDSDVDLLVVMPVQGAVRAAVSKIYGVLRDRTVPVDVVVVTPEQVKRYRNQVGTIIYPALREGQVLYGHVA